MIKYKIVEVNEAEHSIVVRYYTDIITEESLATDILDGVIRRCRTDYSMDLPIPAPVGEDLHQFIMQRAPIDWLKTQEAVQNPTIDTSLSHIVEQLNQENIIEPIFNPQSTTIDSYNPALIAAVQKILTDMHINVS